MRERDADSFCHCSSGLSCTLPMQLIYRLRCCGGGLLLAEGRGKLDMTVYLRVLGTCGRPHHAHSSHSPRKAEGFCSSLASAEHRAAVTASAARAPPSARRL